MFYNPPLSHNVRFDVMLILSRFENVNQKGVYGLYSGEPDGFHY